MKKLIFIIFCLISGVVFSQTSPNLFRNYDVTNGDSAKSYKFFNNKAWSVQVELTNPHGTDGIFVIQESNDNADWNIYSTNSYFILDSNLTVIGSDSLYNVRISGTDTIYTYRFADDYFDANYLRGYFIQNALTSGTLNVIATFKLQD